MSDLREDNSEEGTSSSKVSKIIIPTAMPN